MAKKLFSTLLAFCMIFTLCVTVSADGAIAVSETEMTNITASNFSGNNGSATFAAGTTVTVDLSITRAGKYQIVAKSNAKSVKALEVTAGGKTVSPTVCADSYNTKTHKMGVFDFAAGTETVTIKALAAQELTAIQVKCIDLALSDTETTTISVFDFTEFYTTDANYIDNNRGWGYATFVGSVPNATYNVVAPKAGKYNFKVKMKESANQIGTVSIQNLTNGLSVSSSRADDAAVSAAQFVEIGDIVLDKGLNTIKFVANVRQGGYVSGAQIYSLTADYAPLTVGTQEVTIPATSFIGNNASTSFAAGATATFSFDTEKAGKYQVLAKSDAKNTKAIEVTIGETMLNPTLCANSYNQNSHKIGVYDLGLGTQEVTIKTVSAQNLTGLVIKCVDIPLSETETTVISAFDYTDYFTPDRNYTDNVKPWGYLNLVGEAPNATFSVDAPKAGKYNFKVRLKDSGDKIGSVSIQNLTNGAFESSEKAASLAVSAAEYITIGEVILNEGVNTIKLVTTARSGDYISSASLYGLSADYIPMTLGDEEVSIPAMLFTDLTGGANGTTFPKDSTAKINLTVEKSANYQFVIKTANANVSNAVTITVGDETITGSTLSNDLCLYRVGSLQLEKGDITATITAGADISIEEILIKCLDNKVSESEVTYINANEFASTQIWNGYYENQRGYSYVREDGTAQKGIIAFDSVGPTAYYNVVAPAAGEYDFRILVQSPARYQMKVTNHSDNKKEYLSTSVKLNPNDATNKTYIMTVKKVYLKAGFNNLSVSSTAVNPGETTGYMYMCNIAVEKYTMPEVEFAMMNDDGTIEEVVSGDINGIMVLNGAYVGEKVTCVFAIYRTENGVRQLYKVAVQTFDSVTEDDMFIDTIFDVDTSDGASYDAKMFVLTDSLYGQSKEF